MLTLTKPLRVRGRWASNLLLSAAEAGRIPDALVRVGIGLRLRAKIRSEGRGGPAELTERKRRLLEERANGPITIDIDAANQQHYEVPAAFFKLILGPRLRYSSCYWPAGVNDLTSAELAALDQTVERAQISDGDRILELGCGWGSLSLFMAERFPNSEVVAVSNSRTQKAWIDEAAERLGVKNLRIETADVADFRPTGTFDRVVSIEMFEHVRNHRLLLQRISSWLTEDGTCFIHVFSHRSVAWHFDTDDDSDWLGRHFFSGGTMPSDDLLLHEQQHMAVEGHWRLDGTHYAKTLQAWLDRLDYDRVGCMAALSTGENPAPTALQLRRWRLFLQASIGTWAMAGGTEFGISHYLFRQRHLARRQHQQ